MASSTQDPTLLQALERAGLEAAQVREDGGELKALLDAAGLAQFQPALSKFSLPCLLAKSDEEVEDIAEGAGLKRSEQRLFLKALRGHAAAAGDGLEPPSQALLDFLAPLGLQQYAAKLTANGDGHPQMLLAKDSRALLEVAVEAQFAREDRGKLQELVDQANAKRAAAPSSGGKFAQLVIDRRLSRSILDFRGTGLAVVYMPFKKPATFNLDYNYEFPKEMQQPPHKCSLTILEADVDPELIDPEVSKEAIIMVMGATGAGKSTHVDAMLNHLLGMKFQEPYRFKLVDEAATVKKEALAMGSAASQTDSVTAYKLPAFKDSGVRAKLTIIDTPGFGDTRGLHFDKKIVDQLTKFFKSNGDIGKHVDTLTGVCFVTQASAARLTESQEFIWTSVLSLFGKDIAENIFICFTFADGERPQALDAVKQSQIPMAEHYKFNNSALFADPRSGDKLGKMFWDMGQDNLASFFQKLLATPSKSLKLTQQVLDEREALEASLEGLGPTVQMILSNAETLRQEAALVNSLTEQQLAAKDFKMEVKVPKFTKRPLPGNTNTTTCLTCNWTCHSDCGLANDNQKAGCCAMRNGYCIVCRQGCHWSQHRNVPYILEWYEETEYRTSEDLKQKYDAASNGILDKNKLLSGLTEELLHAEELARRYIMRMKACREKLAAIALRPNAMPSEEYMEMLIQNERNGQKPGYQGRIKVLEDMKKKSHLLQEVEDPHFNPMSTYASDPAIRQAMARRKTQPKKRGAAKSEWGLSWLLG